MLSYVIPSQGPSSAKNGVGSISPQRNLTLHLAPQLSMRNNINNTSNTNNSKNCEQYEDQQKIVDSMLANVTHSAADSSDERACLLSNNGRATSSPPSRTLLLPNMNINNYNNIFLDGGGDIDDSGRVIVGIDMVPDNSDISDEQQQNCKINKKPKLSKLGSKSVGLKRVSFGSSKGSMVETLVFETPTPLSEHFEPSFRCELTDLSGKTPTDNYNIYSKLNAEDSGIEHQEESERSIVRVSIYQSNQPQQICPPEYSTRFEDNLDNSFSSYHCNLEYLMTADMMPGYNRQQSTDSGWDNPFRPGGDLSREADEIVNMIRGGKSITPTEDLSVINCNAQSKDNLNGSTVESVSKSHITQTQSAQNGTNSQMAQSLTNAAAGKLAENNGVTALDHVSKQVVPGPTSASHVVIDEKNKKKGCCVVQ